MKEFINLKFEGIYKPECELKYGGDLKCTQRQYNYAQSNVNNQQLCVPSIINEGFRINSSKKLMSIRQCKFVHKLHSHTHT